MGGGEGGGHCGHDGSGRCTESAASPPPCDLSGLKSAGAAHGDANGLLVKEEIIIITQDERTRDAKFEFVFGFLIDVEQKLLCVQPRYWTIADPDRQRDGPCACVYTTSMASGSAWCVCGYGGEGLCMLLATALWIFSADWKSDWKEPREKKQRQLDETESPRWRNLNRKPATYYSRQNS